MPATITTVMSKRQNSSGAGAPRKRDETAASAGACLLPATLAFVVQFRSDAGHRADRWGGRVEHVHSGATTRFESQRELFGFIQEVLRTELGRS